MKINFEITTDEAKLLTQALQYAVSQTADNTIKQNLSKIINEIKDDFCLDSTIFSYVYSLLDPYTVNQVLPSSNLLNQLSIDQQWINNYLNVGCNRIVQRILQISNSTKKPVEITSNDAKKCIIVQNIVDLLKKTYEDAK